MDTYAIVPEKDINLLEQGIVPWRRPWVSTALPRNLVIKKPYCGLNLFLLSATKYVSPFWLTLKQVNKLVRGQATRCIQTGRRSRPEWRSRLTADTRPIDAANRRPR